MEGAMQQYKIDKRDKQWAVTIDGRDLLYCSQRKWAVRLAKLANEQSQSEHVNEEIGVAQRSDIH
jgi:hypothetical protein